MRQEDRETERTIEQKRIKFCLRPNGIQWQDKTTKLQSVLSLWFTAFKHGPRLSHPASHTNNRTMCVSFNPSLACPGHTFLGTCPYYHFCWTKNPKFNSSFCRERPCYVLSWFSLHAPLFILSPHAFEIEIEPIRYSGNKIKNDL